MFQNFSLLTAKPKCSCGAQLVTDQEDKMRSRGPTPAQLEEDLLAPIDRKVSSWHNSGKKTSNGEFSSGSRRKAGLNKQPLELTYAHPWEGGNQITLFWTSKTPASNSANGNYYWPNLNETSTETLPARRSPRTTRLGRPITTRRRSPWPSWTWPPTWYTDRSRPPGPHTDCGVKFVTPWSPSASQVGQI